MKGRCKRKKRNAGAKSDEKLYREGKRVCRNGRESIKEFEILEKKRPGVGSAC